MKYWVYIQGEVPGSYTPAELANIKEFKGTSMVCPAEEGIADRNWQRAGQFPDIVESLKSTAEKTPPRPPQAPEPDLSGAAEILPKNPNEVLSDASTRIFTHVTGLMKELENRREERALTQSLQRQLSELKNELLALRERNQHLQGQAEMIPGFEEREKRSLEKVARLQSDIMERDERIGGLDKQNEGLRGENERVKRAEDQLSADLRGQRALSEEITQHLASKEFTLAKAFGIIRKLEAMLGEILPEATAGITTTLSGYATPAPTSAPSAESTSAPSPTSSVPEDSAQEAEQTFTESQAPEQPFPEAQPESQVPEQEFPHPQPEPADLSTPAPGPESSEQPAPVPESTVQESSAQEPEQPFPQAQPESAQTPEPAEQADSSPAPEQAPSAYTADSDTPVPDETAGLEGKPEEVPPPWKSAIGKIKGLFGSK